MNRRSAAYRVSGLLAGILFALCLDVTLAGKADAREVPFRVTVRRWARTPGKPEDLPVVEGARVKVAFLWKDASGERHSEVRVLLTGEDGKCETRLDVSGKSDIEFGVAAEKALADGGYLKEVSFQQGRVTLPLEILSELNVWLAVASIFEEGVLWSDPEEAVLLLPEAPYEDTMSDTAPWEEPFSVPPAPGR